MTKFFTTLYQVIFRPFCFPWSISYSKKFYSLSRFYLTGRGLCALEFGNNSNGALTMRYFKMAGVAAFLCVCVYFAGNADLEEAQRAEAEYIERVCLGIHSDYKERGVECQK